MRTAREVLQESIGDLSDAALADLRAEGMVIVAAADVERALRSAKRDLHAWEQVASTRLATDATRENVENAQARVDRLDAALAAGGTDGQS